MATQRARNLRTRVSGLGEAPSDHREGSEDSVLYAGNPSGGAFEGRKCKGTKVAILEHQGFTTAPVSRYFSNT